MAATKRNEFFAPKWASARLTVPLVILLLLSGCDTRQGIVGEVLWQWEGKPAKQADYGTAYLLLEEHGTALGYDPPALPEEFPERDEAVQTRLESLPSGWRFGPKLTGKGTEHLIETSLDVRGQFHFYGIPAGRHTLFVNEYGVNPDPVCCGSGPYAVVVSKGQVKEIKIIGAGRLQLWWT